MTTPKSSKSEMPNSVRVDWNDVGLVATMKGVEDKHILRKVSGFAVPGELLAIMGPSGAGKTSLLNCLAVRTAPTSGELTFNACPYSQSLKGRVAYVHQQEMLLESYTPREHLLFQSTLRMPRDVTKAQREQRVDASIKMLGLEKCQHSLIGDVYHGISKNEKRRVTFATEILTQPAVLYCDEPTTGLDSVMAEVIVKYMKAIAKEGQKGQKVTVIASIHQPSSQVFRLFDRLHFLIDGRTAYFGLVKALETYFADLGYPMPDHTMPADFVMRLCIDPRDPEGAANRRVAISDAWDKQWPNDDARANGAPIQMLPKEKSEVFDSDRQTNWFVQLGHLTKREVIMKVRSKADLRSALLRTIVLGVLFGLTFLQIEKTQSALFTINGCIFFTMMMGVMNICMAASMGIPTRLPTLIREHRNGAYGVPAMYLSKALADMPFDILIALIWSATMFWMVGFRDDFEHFFYFFLGVYALTCVATGIGYLGGYAAPVAAIGMLVVLLNIMPQMLFGGLFMNLDAVPPGFVWLKTISVFRLGFEALMINQWQDYGELPCANGTIAIPCVAANGEQVLRTNGVDPAGSYAETLIWLLIPWCIYHLLAFVLLWRRARPRQFEGAAPEDDTKGELRRQSEAEAPKLNIRRPKIALQWENLSMEADNKQGRILDGNAGFVSPGELLAIMGPSGSGKSTLLKSLAGIAELPLAQGSVVNINGECFSEKVREHTSFLFQDEQLFGNITVREHLLFQCRFRMGKMHPTECAQRSDALITELGLSKCKNTLIGSIGAGISGGERRRLAFATELLTEPTLLFADEATSGLDSAMALNVAKLLHGFARDGAVKKTVLATIHQPSEEVFNLFDKVLILVEGRTVYFGSPTGGLKHFASLELLCPHDESPPDFFMRCVATDAGEDAERIEAKANMEKLLKALPQCDAFQSADKAEKNVSDGDAFQSLRGSGLVAVLTLIRREFLIRRRSKILFKAMIARTFFMALLLGLLYWQLPNDQTSWQSVMGALNMVMINTFTTAGFGLTQELPHAFRPAFRKARAGMYSISAWFWSKTISDLPIDIIGAFCGSSVIFVMTGLGNSVASYLTFVLLVCLTAVMGNAWGYLASAAGGRAEYAFAVFLLTVFPFMIFNGFLITTEEIPIYFRWIEYVGPFKPVFSEMMVTIWNSRELECPQSGPCPFKTGQDVLRLRGLADVDHVYNWVIVIGVYLVGVRLLAWGVMVLRLRLAASNVSQTSKTSKSSKKVADTDGVAHSNEIA